MNPDKYELMQEQLSDIENKANWQCPCGCAREVQSLHNLVSKDIDNNKETFENHTRHLAELTIKYPRIFMYVTLDEFLCLTREYVKMMLKCYWPTHFQYKRVGARGIKVTQEWHRFPKFCEDNLSGLRDAMVENESVH